MIHVLDRISASFRRIETSAAAWQNGRPPGAFEP
jgi:hypothetical protein